MPFKTLSVSAALDLEQYADIDHFRDSERYVSAESTPLGRGNFAVLRARLVLPACSLSLVRTFPRIINGYEMCGRLVIVIPMDDVCSARVNGRSIQQSLILLKGSANCTVYEPEGRLVAILSVRPGALCGKWQDFDHGHLLLRLPGPGLLHLKMLIRGALEAAAKQPDAIRSKGMPQTMQETLFSALDAATGLENIEAAGGRLPLHPYKEIVDRVDGLVRSNPVADLSCERLAEEIGISVRTLQSAVNAVCGSGTHHYGRLKRLWPVPRQLRNGAPGLTVKASALAHGFWHMSEFSSIYRETFGELPSHTLAKARHLAA